MMSSSESVTERIEAAHRHLALFCRRFRRGAWITAIVSVVLLLLLAGYFCYGYSELSALQQPDNLVALAGDMLDEKLPQARQALEEQVNQSASVWAEQLSQQLISSAPTLRERLEDYALSQAEALVDHLNVMGEQEFRKVIDENRSTMEQGFQQLKEDEKLSDETLELLTDALEADLQLNMQDQAKELLDTLIGLNEKLKRLHLGEKLTPEEQIERRVLMIMRRLQMEQLEQEQAEEAALTEAAEPSEEEEAEQSEAGHNEKPVGEEGGQSESEGQR